MILFACQQLSKLERSCFTEKSNHFTLRIFGTRQVSSATKRERHLNSLDKLMAYTLAKIKKNPEKVMGNLFSFMSELISLTNTYCCFFSELHQ